MKNPSYIRRAAAAVILTAALAMVPASQACAQTSRNLGRALTQAYKNGRRKELPSLVPKKETPLPTFSGPKVNMPNTQGAQKQKQTPPSGVTLGYGNAMLFKEMDRQKQDSVRNDTTELKK